MDVRVRFSKHGALRYIGHLDVMRYFQKVIRRADIDIAYSAGFSPHQIMTFASPLGVGLESDGEYMDLRLNSMNTTKELMERLNAHSVPEIQILGVKILPENAGNAMASVAAAEYDVSFKNNRCPKVFENFDQWEGIVNQFMAQEEIIFVKETKKGTREINLKEVVYDFSVDKDKQCMHMLLDASSGNNIKPGQVLIVLLAAYNEELPENCLKIYRIDLYTRDDSNQLISMGDLGVES